MLPLCSALEKQFQAYLVGQNITNLLDRVYRFVNAGESVTPCVFVTAVTGDEIGSPGSGIFKVPVVITQACAATDIINDSTGLDTLTSAVEAALTGAQEAINALDTDVHIFNLTMRNAPSPKIEGNTYQYFVVLEATCKKIN